MPALRKHPAVTTPGAAAWETHRPPTRRARVVGDGGHRGRQVPQHKACSAGGGAAREQAGHSWASAARHDNQPQLCCTENHVHHFSKKTHLPRRWRSTHVAAFASSRAVPHSVGHPGSQLGVRAVQQRAPQIKQGRGCGAALPAHLQVLAHVARKLYDMPQREEHAAGKHGRRVCVWCREKARSSIAAT